MIQAGPSTQSQTTIIRNPKLIPWIVFIVLSTAVAAYYRAFVGMTSYDDEGTMMWMVQRFFDGQPLYDRIISVYGPLYYFYEWCAHILTGMPVSHQSVRLVSITFRVAASLMVFLLAYRSTGRLLWASLAHILAFRAMYFIGTDPAHPQEAGIFLLGAISLTFFAKNSTWRAAMVGALAGLAVVTKINLGIFVVIALSAGLAYSLRPKWPRTVASMCVSAGMLTFPALLMWGNLSQGWAVKFCALVVLSTASALLIVSGAEWDTHVEFRDVLIGGMSFISAIAVLCWFVLAHGSTMHAMIDWLIVKPRTSFGPVWYFPAHIQLLALPWAAMTLVLASCVRLGRFPAAYVVFLKVVFGVVTLALIASGRYDSAISFASPLLWLIAAVSGKVKRAVGDRTARALLLLLAVTQVLYAYPVAGPQIPFATVLMLSVAVICLSDGLEWIWSSASKERLSMKWLRSGKFAVALLLIGTYLGMVWRAESNFTRHEPLGLPGTGPLRLDHQRAVALRALVAKANVLECHTLVTEPGLFSFNFFTRLPPPDRLSVGAWMLFISPQEQEGIVREVAADPKACVIRLQAVTDAYALNYGNVSSQPLVRYIRENFTSVLDISGYSFLVKKD